MDRLHAYGKIYSFGTDIGLSPYFMTREDFEEGLLSPTGEYQIDRSYPFYEELRLSEPDKIIGRCTLRIEDDGIYVDATIRQDMQDVVYAASQSADWNKKLSFMVHYKRTDPLTRRLIKPSIRAVFLSETGFGDPPEFKFVKEEDYYDRQSKKL